MRLKGRQLCCSCLRRFAFYILFIFALSCESSLNRDETVSGKVVAEETGSSQVELEPAGNKVICEIVSSDNNNAIKISYCDIPRADHSILPYRTGGLKYDMLLHCHHMRYLTMAKTATHKHSWDWSISTSSHNHHNGITGLHKWCCFFIHSPIYNALYSVICMK